MHEQPRRPSWFEALVSFVFRRLPLKHGAHRLLDRLAWVKPDAGGNLVVVDYCGQRLCVDPSDLVGWHMLMLRNFDPEVSEVLLKFRAERNDVFWDVGANQGACAYAIAASLGDCKIVAIEPQRRFKGLLEGNLDLLADRRHRVFSVGLSDQRGQFDLYTPVQNRGAASMRRDFVGRAAIQEKVEAWIAEDIKQESGFDWPTLIKIDVEGMEPQVLRALAVAFESKSVRCCVFECHRSEAAVISSMHERMAAFGYKVFAIRKTLFATKLVLTDRFIDGSTDYALVRSDLQGLAG